MLQALRCRHDLLIQALYMRLTCPSCHPSLPIHPQASSSSSRRHAPIVFQPEHAAAAEAPAAAPASKAQTKPPAPQPKEQQQQQQAKTPAVAPAPAAVVAAEDKPGPAAAKAEPAAAAAKAEEELDLGDDVSVPIEEMGWSLGLLVCCHRCPSARASPAHFLTHLLPLPHSAYLPAAGL